MRKAICTASLFLLSLAILYGLYSIKMQKVCTLLMDCSPYQAPLLMWIVFFMLVAPVVTALIVFCGLWVLCGFACNRLRGEGK